MDEGLPETTFRSHPKNPTRLCHRVCGDEVRVDDEEKHRRHAEMGAFSEVQAYGGGGFWQENDETTLRV